MDPFFFHSPLITLDCAKWTNKDFERTKTSSRWNETEIEIAMSATALVANPTRPIPPTTATLGPYQSTSPSQTDSREQYTALEAYWEVTRRRHQVSHSERLLELEVPCTASPAGKSRMAHRMQSQRRNTRSSLLGRTALFRRMPPSAQRAVPQRYLGHLFRMEEVVVPRSLCLSLAECLLPTPWLRHPLAR